MADLITIACLFLKTIKWHWISGCYWYSKACYTEIQDTFYTQPQLMLYSESQNLMVYCCCQHCVYILKYMNYCMIYPHYETWTKATGALNRLIQVQWACTHTNNSRLCACGREDLDDFQDLLEIVCVSDQTPATAAFRATPSERSNHFVLSGSSG